MQLLLEGDREATSASYQSAWNGWFNWCLQSDEDPLSPSGIGTVLRFLTFLFKEGKAYRTINVCRSMLSGTSIR